MILAICFDLDGTLIRMKKPYATLLDETFEACVDRADPAWATHYNKRFFEYLRGIEPEPYRRSMTDVCETFDLSGDPTGMAEDLLEREFAAATVDDATHDAITTLSTSHDHPLGIITNGVGPVQREKLARTDLDDMFDAVVVSSEVGAHKPDTRVFEAATDRLDADRYVMIGDDYGGDIVGAHEAGFEAIHVGNDDLTVPDAIDQLC